MPTETMGLVLMSVAILQYGLALHAPWAPGIRRVRNIDRHMLNFGIALLLLVAGRLLL